MSETEQDLSQRLREAIQMESDGHTFYLMAAGSTVDPKGKQVFASLAEEELGHMKFLQTHFGSIQKTGALSAEAKLGTHRELPGKSPVFSDEIGRRIANAGIEMSALSIGITLEMKSVDFYRAQAQKAKDSTARAFFNELADWETEHYHALLRQQELLKDEYYSSGGFAPF